MYTRKMHNALRRDTEEKQNQVTDLLDEVERLQKVFTRLAELMRHYEVPSEIGRIIIKEAGK